MKILNFVTFNQTIKFIPRFYPESINLDFEFYNESTRETTTESSEYDTINGYITYAFSRFDRSYNNNDTIQFKVLEGEDVVYRGKLFVTTQETQEYKLTQGLYSYE